MAEKQIFNRLSRVHERYRQTDGRKTTYSEREREGARGLIFRTHDTKAL